MRTINELEQYYNTSLTTELQILEDERISVSKKVILIHIIFAVLTVASLLSAILIESLMIAGSIITIASIALWVILHGRAVKDYTSNFKDKIIKKLVEFADESLKYNPQGRVSLDEYYQSEIFKNHVDRCNGDDLVYGTMDKTDIRFSELHTEYRSTDSKGKSQYHTIFRGLFFIGDFNKHFNGKTFVLPDFAEKTFGKFFGNFFQSMNKGRGELIKLEDPEFEKQFVVYGDDQVEARYILSTSLMRRILDYKNKHDKNIFISFSGSKIYVAISYAKALFEPKIHTTLLDFNLIKSYFDDLNLALGLVEDLNLNTRIWTKE